MSRPPTPLGTIVSILGLVALMAWSGGATAPDQADARVSRADVGKSLRIAHRYWSGMSAQFELPGFRCDRGDVRGVWKDDLGSAMASALLAGCFAPKPKINLERPTIRRLADNHACAVIVHEFGHLLGYRHNQTSGSIMYSSTTGLLAVGPRVPKRATWTRAYRGKHCGRL